MVGRSVCQLYEMYQSHGNGLQEETTGEKPAMTARSKHFLLFAESQSRASNNSDPSTRGGRWRFVLESLDGGERLEASDIEEAMHIRRIELLSVVRGLEALDQPSSVSLVTPSRYVSHGIRHGLKQWQETDWRWEHFGEMRMIPNRDLWQRLDTTMTIHDVRCRTWRFDYRVEHTVIPAPRVTRKPLQSGDGGRAPWQESSGVDVIVRRRNRRLTQTALRGEAIEAESDLQTSLEDSGFDSFSELANLSQHDLMEAAAC